MQFQDVLRVAFSALRQRRTRSVLTILGVAIGSSVILGLIASSEGLNNSIVGELDKFRATTIMVFPADPSQRLTAMDQRRIESYPGVKKVVPLFLRGATLKSGNKEKAITVLGVDIFSFREAVGGFNLKEGYFFSAYDPNSVVLGQYLANPSGEEAAFARLNQVVSLEWIQFEEGGMKKITRSYAVQGILEEFGPSLFVDIDRTAFISPAAARALFGLSDFSSLFVIVNTPGNVDPVVSRLENQYGDDIDIVTAKEILKIVESITGVLTVFLGGIAAVSLVVASIGVTNIMFVSVMERTQEIGILKAVGFQNTDVLRIFLAEALLTGVLGGVLGSGLGILFAVGITRIFGGRFGGGTEFEGGFSPGAERIVIQPTFAPELFLLTIGFAILAAMLAGIYPSWRAARMDPVESLRSAK
ncbi:MAG: ABC transporter permease [Candidatus Heimdallarchaeota archaeon]